MDILANSTEAIPNPHARVPAAAAGRTTHFERREVLKAAVDIASPEQIVEVLVQRAENREGCSVVGISGPYAVAMSDDPAVREAFLKSDVLIPDGRGFVWGARMLGVPCGERIAIPDLCEKLLAIGNQRGWKVFLYGATEAVNAAACKNLRTRFPGLARVDGQHGYNQGIPEEDKVIERLKDEKFQILIVARPSPAKEHFLARCCAEAGVIGVAAGGYADILAGLTRRAPAIVQSLGFEWLFRVVQEPRRLWKRVGWANVRFGAAVCWKHLRQRSRNPPWGSVPIHIAAVMLAVLVSYNSSMSAPYHFDDPEYIKYNPYIRSFSALSENTSLAHRKIWWLSNVLCYKISEWLSPEFLRQYKLESWGLTDHKIDNPDVRVFRLWNVGCHLIAALALYGLLRRALRSQASSQKGGAQLAGSPYDLVAFAGALIFATHPLCTEAVTYISGRDNGLGGMFFLLGLYTAAIAFERATGAVADAENKPVRRSRWPGWLWPSLWTVFFGACSVLTKESYITFPGAALLLYLCFYRGATTRTISWGALGGILAGMAVLAWGAAGRREGYFPISLQMAIGLIVAGFFIGNKNPAAPPQGWRQTFARRMNVKWAFVIAVIGLGVASVAAFPYTYQRAIGALVGQENSSPIRSLYCQVYAVPCTLLNAISPIRVDFQHATITHALSIDHDFPTLTEWNDPRVLTGGAIVLALLIYGAVGIYRRSVGGFGVMLALLSILPTNSIVERGDIVSERNFYIAAACGGVVLAWFFARSLSVLGKWMLDLKNPADMREAGLYMAALAGCVAMPFAAFTNKRNDEWGDPYRLWQATAERSPNKIRVLYNYGASALSLKRYDEAMFAFEKAKRIGEIKMDNHLFRADEGVQVKCFHLAYANIANIYLIRYQKDPERNADALSQADKIYKEGLERTTYDPDLTMSYAQFLIAIGRWTDCEEALQRSLNLHSWAEQTYFPLGVSYMEANFFALGQRYLDLAVDMKERQIKGLDADPSHLAEAYAYKALNEMYLDRMEQAKGDFRKCLQKDWRRILLLLANSQKTRNPKLKPLQTNPPDGVATALSITRWDLLDLLAESIDEELKDKTSTVDSKLLTSMKDVIHAELKRRDDVQKKREKFGFKDDPDELEKQRRAKKQ